MNPREEMLCEKGSVAALAVEIGEQAASEALYTLSLKTPEEIRSSWPLVIAYNRLQMLYELASSMGDAKLAADISAKASKMVTDQYS